MARFPASHHLRRHVLRRSEHDSAVGEPVVSQEMAGDPEIRHPHPVSRTEEDVGGLDVAMDHTTTVGVIQRLCHGQGDAGCLGWGKRSSLPSRDERLSPSTNSITM